MADPTIAFGRTRTRVAARHAFLAPDGHVPAPLPGWRAAEGVTLISPQMGRGVDARFTMTLLRFEAGGESAPPPAGVERFVHVLNGALTLARDGGEEALAEGAYAFLPADVPHAMRADGPARAVTFERRYLPHAAEGGPSPLVGHVGEVPSEPFLGDARVQVKRLLPDAPAFDLAVNVMTFEPGSSIPFAETHPNEHGLLMLSGGGIYRLGDDWYPITAGDALWMGPFCPQWFGALGDDPGSYLLYKDQGRDWLSAAEHP